MPRIAVDRLQPGVFISLGELSWLEHPFLLNRFRLVSDEQIRVLRSLGLEDVEWDPERSTAQPLSADSAAEAETEVDFSTQALDSMLDAKRSRSERVRAQREGLARCERLFEQEASGISEIMRDLGSRPNEAYGRAKSTIDRLVGGLLNAQSLAVHLVNMKVREPGPAHHAMNVSVLSLLLGKAAQLGEEELRTIGLGAMFHDIGKQDVPPRILRNPQRPPAEEQFYQAHVGYGIKQIATIANLPLADKNIIACHHERWDGEGFPNHLTAAKIPRLARLVAIANRYDNLCNPFDPKLAKTPAEALTAMFKLEKDRYDPELLQLFVKSIGIYPP
ncbi:MAG: DUF3391 domain-containing protein, partial [Azonexus sp.]|nr:DUF3391 domain-containing protein [Azonexus sp.]